MRSDRGLCEFIRRGRLVGGRFRELIHLRPIQAIRADVIAIDDEARPYSSWSRTLAKDTPRKRGEGRKSERSCSNTMYSNNLSHTGVYSSDIGRQGCSYKDFSRQIMAEKESSKVRDGWAPAPLSWGDEASIFQNPESVSSQYSGGSPRNVRNSDDDMSVESIDRDPTEEDLSDLENFTCLPEEIFEL